MRLQPDAHVAAVGQDLVFLDVSADEYFCLPGAAADFALAGDGETLARCDDDLAQQLLNAGLLELDIGPRPTRGRAPLPTPGTTDLPSESDLRIGLDDVGRMSIAALRLYRYGPRGSLASLIAAARTVRSPGRYAREIDPLELARRCEHLLPWLPFQGECLFRSFVTATAMRRAGVSVSWIFGVQTWPFRAHCWLQLGDVVLNDAAERVSGYVPIMVV